jgi:hypothetical protein
MRGPRMLALAGCAPGMRVRVPPSPARPLATPLAAAEWRAKVPHHSQSPHFMAL